MQDIINLGLAAYQWVLANMTDIVIVWTAIVTIASIIVKFTPTLKDDDALKGIIKFIGKYLALNKYSPTSCVTTVVK